MAFTIPDKGEGANDLQSILFQEYLEVLAAGIAGTDCVLAGCAVTPNATLVLNVEKGAVLSNGALFAVTAATVTIGAADATNPRLDLVVITSAGAKAVRAGTAAAAPKPPARTANDVVLAVVYVPALDATIDANQIVDMRVIRTQGPITIAKTTAAVTFNNTSSIQTYVSVTLPNGLFLAGKVLRVNCGGNYLLNSGTPTITLTIAYGGTTMFADVSVAAAADADRGAWRVAFELTAQGNADQALSGAVTLYAVNSARTAPTTGIAGDLTVGTDRSHGFAGSAAVDSDTADRTLTVQWTMSVANAADEMVMEFATVELV